MRSYKLTAFILLISTITLVSCKRDDYLVPATYSARILTMNGAQEVPSVATSAVGTITADYSQTTKILTFTMTWGGLSGNATAAHIHGTAEAGVNAPVLQSFTSGITGKVGNYTSSLFVDGVKIQESLLLAGKYYMNVHTAANPGGEIRGQLILTKN